MGIELYETRWNPKQGTQNWILVWVLGGEVEFWGWSYKIPKPKVPKIITESDFSPLFMMIDPHNNLHHLKELSLSFRMVKKSAPNSFFWSRSFGIGFWGDELKFCVGAQNLFCFVSPTFGNNLGWETRTSPFNRWYWADYNDIGCCGSNKLWCW